MFEMLGISSQALFGQLLVGLINGSFYALLSLGLAVIFGMLNIINFAHGAQYMMGAFAAFFIQQRAGLSYWWALVIVPLVVGLTGIVIERLLLQRLHKLDHLYGLLLTFGLALIIEGTFRNFFGSSGLPYAVPPLLQGGQNLGFMFLPNYRAWVVVFSLAVCLTTWFVIERESANGGQSDHCRVRGRGDRRHGFDHGCDRDRIRIGHHRGADQGLLPRSVEHGDLRHHGDRAAAAARRPVRTERLTWSSASPIRRCSTPCRRARAPRRSHSS
jgi:hypothetical protein